MKSKNPLYKDYRGGFQPSSTWGKRIPPGPASPKSPPGGRTGGRAGGIPNKRDLIKQSESNYNAKKKRIDLIPKRGPKNALK